MLTGSRPFSGDHELALMYGIMHEDPKPVTALRPDLPDGLRHVVEKMLAKDVADRYGQISSLIDDLQLRQEASQITSRGSLRLLVSSFEGRFAAIAPVGAVILLIALAASFWFTDTSSEKSAVSTAASSETARPAIAVLPLNNHSGSPEQEYFAHGMTEALINNLAKIEGLRVISRTSAMRYLKTDKTLPQIATELGVDFIVEGSILQAGNDVRIIAQLIEADSDEHLWAESFEYEMEDVLSLQRQVSLTVAREIKVKLSVQDEARLRESPTVNPDAYKLYLKGLHARHTELFEGWRHAAAYFEQSIEHDASFAPAHAALALMYTLSEFDPKRAVPQIEKALDLDPSLSEAFVALGVYREFTFDWEGAEDAFTRALTANPGSSQAHHELALMYMRQARFDEALEHAEKAWSLDPLSVPVYSNFGAINLFRGRFEEAISYLTEALEMDPAFTHPYWHLGQTYQKMGRLDEAIRAFESGREAGGDELYAGFVGHAYASNGNVGKALEIIESFPEGELWWTAWHEALVRVGLGEHGKALELLERLPEDRRGWFVYLRVLPALDPLRSEPGFHALLKKAGLESTRRRAAS